MRFEVSLSSTVFFLRLGIFFFYFVDRWQLSRSHQVTLSLVCLMLWFDAVMSQTFCKMLSFQSKCKCQCYNPNFPQNSQNYSSRTSHWLTLLCVSLTSLSSPYLFPQFSLPYAGSLFEIFLIECIGRIERPLFLFSQRRFVYQRGVDKEFSKKKEVKNVCNCYYSFIFGMMYKMTKKE